MNTLAFPASRPNRAARPGDHTIQPIETRRLLLRRPAEDDIVAITALAGNISVAAKLWEMPHPYTIADAGRLLRRQRDQSGLTVFAVTERESGTLIGCARIETSEPNRATHIAFWIGEPHWNRGYATELCQRLVDHAFTLSPQLISIRATARVAHTAAQRVLEKCSSICRPRRRARCAATLPRADRPLQDRSRDMVGDQGMVIGRFRCAAASRLRGFDRQTAKTCSPCQNPSPPA